MATRQLNQLTITQTQDLGSVLNGGVFSLDGGNFVIPNVADGVAPQDVATVNQLNGGVPVTAGTVYVTNEADFGPLVNTNVPGVGLVDLHQLSANTNYILLNSVVLTDNLLFQGNHTVKISAANPVQFLISAPSIPASPMFFLPSGTPLNLVIFQDLQVLAGSAFQKKCLILMTEVPNRSR